MTYRFTIIYTTAEGIMSQVKLREHSREKARRKFHELHPDYTIISVR